MKAILLAAGFTCLLTGCVKDDSTSSIEKLTIPVNPVGSAIVLGDFPLQHGNRWSYSTKSQRDNSAIQTEETVFTVGADTLINGLNYTIINDGNGYEYNVFHNATDGLHDWVNGADRYCLKYPITTFDQWDYNEGIGAAENRYWMGYAKVTTPAGVFDCVELVVSSSGSGQGNHSYDYQYYSAKGLVQEVSESYYHNPFSQDPNSYSHTITVKNLVATNF